MLNQLSQARDKSTVVEVVRTVSLMFCLGVGNSFILRQLRRSFAIGSNAVQTSTLARIGQLVVTWLRYSYLCRWLTAEPDPQVIVIDLRETYTVGPFVRTLDWGICHLRDVGQQSMLFRSCVGTVAVFRRAPFLIVGILLGTIAIVNVLHTTFTGSVTILDLVPHVVLLVVSLLATRIRVPLEKLRDARTVQLAVAAFEPPKPPDEVDSEHRRQ